MQNNNQEEITLKDIFLTVGDYVSYVKGKWKKILIIGLVFGILFALKSTLEIPMYKESLTFMMDEKEGGGVPGLELLGGILGGNKQNDNLGKILQLFESKRIIHNTLFDSIVLRGKKEVLANHYLEQYGIEELIEPYQYPFGIAYKVNWPQSLLKEKSFKFTHNDIDNFTPKENQYLRVIYEKIAGNTDVGISPQLSSSMDEDTGMMALRMKSKYEDLTLGVLNNIYKQLSEFFILKAVEKQQKTYDIMKIKRDSVITALMSAEYALADFKDRNRNLVTVKGYLKDLRLEREVTILNVMYAEVVKQMEATDFALKNKTPIVQIIDLPRRPIVPSQISWKKNFITAFLVGCVLTGIFFAGRKMLKDIMA